MVRLEQGLCLTDYYNNFLKGWIEGQDRNMADGTSQTVQYQCGRDDCTRTCWLQEEIFDHRVIKTNLISCEGSNCPKYG